MKVTSNFLEKFMKTEVLSDAAAVDSNDNIYVKQLKPQANNLTDKSMDASNENKLMDRVKMNGTTSINDMNLYQNLNGNNVNLNQRNLRDLNGNSFSSNASNGSGYRNYERINCSNGKLDILRRKNSNEMIKSSSPSSIISNQSSSSEAASSNAKPLDAQQRKKFIQMIQFLDQQNQHLQNELAKEKKRRAEELSRIIKSLLCFESKLKSEKKVINQKLYEKDDEIKRLINLNQLLKNKYKCAAALNENNFIINDDNVTNVISHTDNDIFNEYECKYPEVMYCQNCRKDFYDLNGKENWTQTGKDGRNLLGDHQLNSNGSTEHGSSSDETLSSSFYGARRSIRYTSKRTFGTFRDYMRSRCMSIDHPSLENSANDDESHTTSSYEKMNLYSNKIERIHGVRRISSFEFDSETDNANRTRKLNFSSSGPETDNSSPHECDEDEVFYPAQSFASLLSKTTKEFSEKQLATEKFEATTDDWYASASDADENESIRTKSYGYNNTVNPVLECVNQILLQESMEESLNDPRNLQNNCDPISLESNDNHHVSLNSSSGNSSINSKDGQATITRKRVHFSTKNSMVHVPRNDDDDILMNSVMGIDENSKLEQTFNYESIYSNEYEPIGSEHNSSNLYVDMESKLDDSIINFVELTKEKHSTAMNCKHPPALPPKPANLMKFKRALKVSPLTAEKLKQNNSDDKNDNKPEPDYCSISEINEAINIQIVAADVHKIPDCISSSSNDDEMSQKTDDTAETLSDIPKLPNVAAIIVPKTPKKSSSNRKTSTEKSPIKSIPTSPGQTLFRPKSPGQVKRQHVPNILAEINKKILQNSGTPLKQINLPQTLSTSKKFMPKNQIPLIPILKQTSNVAKPIPLKPNVPLLQINPMPTAIINEDKLPLQEEFDWYNLDAEYDKSPITNNDDIKSSDLDCIDDPLSQSIEYNLDEEFALANSNQSDDLDLKENSLEDDENNCILTKLNLKESIVQEEDEENLNCENFLEDNLKITTNLENKLATILDPTPSPSSLSRKTNFIKFIDNSGLSTKPLPRQRKIYFSGPFV